MYVDRSPAACSEFMYAGQKELKWAAEAKANGNTVVRSSNAPHLYHPLAL